MLQEGQGDGGKDAGGAPVASAALAYPCLAADSIPRAGWDRGVCSQSSPAAPGWQGHGGTGRRRDRLHLGEGTTEAAEITCSTWFI